MIGGFLLGTAIGKIFLSIHRLHDNAWRIPFLLSIALGIIAVYLRLKVTESPIFLQIEKRKQTLAFPLKEIIIHHYKKIILLILIVCSNSSAFYYIYTFIPTYLAHTLHVKLAYSLDINIIGLLTLAIIVPLIGLLINKKNVRAFLAMGLVAFTVLPIPAILLINQHPLHAILPIEIIYTIIVGFTSPFLAVFITLLFPENIRFTALAIVLGIPTGGLFPFFGLLIKAWTHIEFATTLLLSLISCGSLIILIIFRKSPLLTLKLDDSQDKCHNG